MTRSQFEVLKDEVWKAGVKLSRPKTTTIDALKRIVFDAAGTEIYEENWDLLIVLDGCRADVLRSVAADYSFIDYVETTFSKGSSSREWIATNFRGEYREETNRTMYVTGNPFSDEYLSEEDFAELDEVWRYEWDEDVGTILPGPLTDRAIQKGRETDAERMIVHYMQPHFPSIADPELGSEVDPETNVWIDSVWDRLESGSVSKERVWEAYRENLRHVLDSVAVLLENVDADDVIITADHGNGFGEAGIYGHPRLRTHRVLREVPWVTTTATDERTHQPVIQDEAESEEDVKERLADLGYR